MITPNEVATLRSLKSTCIILVLLLRLGSPINAKKIAEILAIDYQTCRKGLHSLAYLGLITNTPTGWIILPGGQQLVLPVTINNPVDNPVDNARISRLTPPSPSSLSVIDDSLLLEEEEEEEEEKRDNIAFDDRISDALEELEYAGVMVNQPIIEIVKNNVYITADYIQFHTERLEAQHKFSSGLLIKVMKDHDPMYTKSEIDQRRRERSYRKYNINY